MTDALSKNDQTPAEKVDALSRRELLAGAGALGVLLASGAALAADAPGHRHAEHARRHPKVLKATNACVARGRQCVAHCLDVFREGDVTLADCANSVNQMVPICEAFSYQLATNSKYVKDLSAVCRQACKDCEEECRKHEDEHRECRDCAEACAALVRAIDRRMA